MAWAMRKFKRFAGHTTRRMICSNAKILNLCEKPRGSFWPGGIISARAVWSRRARRNIGGGKVAALAARRKMLRSSSEKFGKSTSAGAWRKIARSRPRSLSTAFSWTRRRLSACRGVANTCLRRSGILKRSPRTIRTFSDSSRAARPELRTFSILKVLTFSILQILAI
jgi:hypothetical protein